VQASVRVVPLERVQRWHVSWSHDGRPTVVVEHAPEERVETTRPRTILWFHLGGTATSVVRTATSYRYPGRRHPAYRAMLERLRAAGIPRDPDERRVLRGTRDERLGASVSPLLLARTRWGYRRPRRPGRHGGSLSA
jgi:hypothetical protein